MPTSLAFVRPSFTRARSTPSPGRTARRLAAAALSAGLLVAWGCGAERTTVPAGTLDPDKLLYERGTDALGRKRWITAREYFRQIVEGYPQSPYRAPAKLSLGDAYLGENTAESLVLAINEFREFLTFYPTHERADYAQFKLAMCHHVQMAKPERDQSETKEAIREFEEFFERFPNSSLTAEARVRYREARDRLSESEYRVGLFYYRTRWYPGAIDRFKSVVKDDPQFTHLDAVYYYLAESLVLAKMEAEALPYLERLLEEFPKSEYVEDTRRRVAELKAAANLAKPKAEGPPTPSR
jgi:outer membrane protein assembly factor BamD